MKSVTTLAVLVLMPASAVLGSEIGEPRLGNVSAPAENRDEVFWWQMPDCAGSIVSSEVISILGLESEVANDFFIWYEEPPVYITAVYWFGHCEGEPCPELLHFNFFIYEDDGTSSPGQVFDAHLHVQAAIIEEYCDGESYVYRAEIESVALPLETILWISIQADDHDLPHRWGILEAESIHESQSRFRSEYYGYPEWVPAEEVVGHAFDASFVLEGYLWAPYVESTTWGAVKALFR